MSGNKSAPAFSALFWNLWDKAQLTPARLEVLRKRLEEIVRTYKPDVLGLNEVVSDQSGKSAPILKYLEQLGYHTYFVPLCEEPGKPTNGSAIACRIPPDEIKLHDLAVGKTPTAAKAIFAAIPFAGQRVNVVVNHLAHLVPTNWRAHLTHHRTLRQLMQSPVFQSSTIIGGDFNQFKFMPSLWSASKHYNRITGNFLKPTWRWMGKIPLIQANYDNIFWAKHSPLRLKDYRVLERAPSDHSPLLARFTVSSYNNDI